MCFGYAVGMPAASDRPRGPYAKSALRRAQIATAVMDIVRADGLQAVSPAAVARRAGLTPATVTYHFPTRDALLVGALQHREEQLTAAVGTDREVDLAALLSSQAVADARDRNYVALFGAMSAAAADPGHPAHEWLRGHHRRVREGLADALRRLQAGGRAHPDVEPEQFARQMVAVWDGLQAQWLADPDFDLAAEVTAAFRSLTRADLVEAKRALEALAADL